MSESAVADEIGRIGESYFDYQMSQTDLLVGKIDPDRMGKDRVIETKLARRDEELSFDTRPAPMACSIQIKTVLPTTKAVKVSLSVAERLAQGPTPAFVYIIRLDGNRKPVEIRVIHIFGTSLGRILKRLRKEFAEGKTEYGDRTITFQIKEAKKIGLLGDDLARYLQQEIGPDMDKYIERKRLQKRELGFEKHNHTKLSGSFEAGAISDFVDGLLGLKPLAIAEMKAEQLRFDIAVPIAFYPKFQPGMKAHFMPKPNARCTLVLGQGRDAVETICDVTFPPVTSIPLQFFKALLRSPILDATFSSNEFRVSTNEVATSDRRTVTEWMAYYTIIVGLPSADGLSIGVRTSRGVEHLGVARGTSPSEEMAAEYILRLLKALRSLREEAGIPDQPVAIDDVYLMGSCILSAQDSMLESFRDDVTFGLENPTQEEVPEEVQVLFISGFTLGKENYVYSAQCTMQSSVVNDRLFFSQNGPLRFLEANHLSDFETDLPRYQRKMMRVSRSNVCATYITQGTERTEMTQVDGKTEDAAVFDLQQANG